jgi:hypothetical protein
VVENKRLRSRLTTCLTRVVSGGGRLRPNGDRVGAATAIDDLRHRHMQLTVDQSRVRLRHIAGPAETNHAREAPVPALDEVKARFAKDAAWSLLADNQDRVASGQETHAFRGDARQIDDDVERLIGLVHVNRRRAFPSQCIVAKSPAELREDATHFVGEVADFRGKGNGVDT